MSFRARLTGFFLLTSLFPWRRSIPGGPADRRQPDWQGRRRASGIAVTSLVRASGSRPVETVEFSELTAAQYAHSLAGPGIQVVVRCNGVTLASTLAAAAQLAMPAQRGEITNGSTSYDALTRTFAASVAPR